MNLAIQDVVKRPLITEKNERAREARVSSRSRSTATRRRSR